MEECVIIIPTHSNYADICKNFIQLLKRNWNECPYKIIVSMFGEEKRLDGVINLFNKNIDNIATCLLNAAKHYKAKMYLVFLGDAFISKKINNKRIELFISEFQHYDIEYCRLYHQFSKYRNIKVGLTMRALKSYRYSFSFVAFAATGAFIENEFSEGETDYDFENKYLEIARNTKQHFYYSKDTMLVRNDFHILPGIEKGKWDRIAHLKLRIRNPQIELAQREKNSRKWQIYLILRRTFLICVSEKTRIKTKQLMKKAFRASMFSTEK